MCYNQTKKQKETGKIYQAGKPKRRQFFARPVLNLLLFIKKQDDSYFEVSGQNVVFIRGERLLHDKIETACPKSNFLKTGLI